MRWYSFAIRIFLLIGLLFCIYIVVRRGVAAWYFREGSPDAIQTALKWDPANPQYYDALGTIMHLYANGGNSNDIVQLYQNATRLSPHDAQFWADLGAGNDWAGRTSEALGALQQARHLFPNSPDINWRLANFYVRTRKTSEALQALQTVLRGDSAAWRNVFVLATRATGDTKAILGILPIQAPIFFDYLNFQIETGNLVGAQEVWARILELNLSFDLSKAFPYLDALIQRKDLVQLQEAWVALTQRFPTQIEHAGPTLNLVTNGNFDHDILNGGLDWRVVPTDGALVSLDSADASARSRALRITFDGSRNLGYEHVFQYVPVQPNTRYRFSGRMRVQSITTDSGPRFQVCDGYNLGRLFVSTENLVGTSGWLEQHADFRTGNDAHLLLIRVARPMSHKFDSQIAGTVWIAGVSLNTEELPH
jgi:Tetratricopeptide repeat